MTALIGAWSPHVRAASLEVGSGKTFTRIEDANRKAQPGDTILIYPRDNGAPYEQVAVTVRTRDLSFRAVPARKGEHVRLSGKGFDYSGEGRTPRAIFQFDPGADRCTLEGFDLSAAHNKSHNGAGVRINQANHVVIRDCAIHDNDMGIMSGGDGTPKTAIDQRIEYCSIHHNGNLEEPGYNHNLYLGGTSVTLNFCEVHDSLTGHNVKSRAHYTRVQYCYVHHSANREFDLVDSADTVRPDSHAVLLGNIIAKNPKSKGNRSVIQFGQDGGKEHDGTLFLAFNTIVTPFLAPVVDLSAPKVKARLIGNLICDGGSKQNHQVVAEARAGATLESITGVNNWFGGDFRGNGTKLDAGANRFERSTPDLFINPVAHDYHLARPAALVIPSPPAIDTLGLPIAPGMTEADAEPPLKWQYRHSAAREARPVGKGLIYGAIAN